MSERIAELLRQVRRASEEPEYRPPLCVHFPHAAAQSIDEVRKEIAQEVAYSLGKAGKKLEKSILVLQAMLACRNAEPLSRAEFELIKSEFDCERARAKKYFYHLTVQREALGFRRNDELAARYPIPSWIED